MYLKEKIKFLRKNNFQSKITSKKGNHAEMDIHNKKKFSFSEKQLTDKGKTSEHFKGINRHKKRKMNHSMDIRVIRDLNTIITDIKQKYLNDVNR